MPENHLNILEISAGLIHPSLPARMILHRILDLLPAANITRSSSIEAARQLSLNRFHSVVIYLHRKKISASALRALDRFVAEGGGLLAIHSATASFKTSDEYFDLLGGRFVGHDPVMEFEIIPRNLPESPFSTGSPFTVRDELYIHEIKNDITVHHHSVFKGNEEPVVWTRRHHQGRVCYLEPGHCASSLKHPEMVKLVKEGLAWVSKSGEEK